MGLYDYIKCEYPLPDDGPQDALFQTKDTDANYMEAYRITTDGRLVHQTVRYETVPPEVRPYPNADDWRGVVGCFRSVPTGDVTIHYHGDIYFYESIGGEWFEYVARFTEGKVSRIWRVKKPNPPSLVPAGGPEE